MDRKAWIVVTLCGILLAISMYQSAENTKVLQEQRIADEKKIAAEQPALTQEEKPAELTVEKRPTPEEHGIEENHEIKTETNTFTLSSYEGGIAQSELLEEKSVHGDTNVTMNDLGRNRIGALTRLSGATLEKAGFYELTDRDENSATFKGQTQNNLDVTKTWTRVTDGAGSDHRLTFSLTLANPTAGEISLSDVAIFSGSSAPVHLDERPNYLNFFWNENGDFDSETNGYFSSFFGADPTEFNQTLAGGTNFTGVENQFFATIISPKEAYPATYRVVQKTVEFPASRGGETGNSFNTTLSLRDEAIPAGESRTYVYDIFMGPKNNSLIRSLDGEKKDVMAYGFFGWISHWLNVLLNFLAGIFGGGGWAWGWAIVVTTLIIRIIMWPLHAKSTRTMKRMSKLQPKIKALKEKYPDNPNKMNQEMMQLYKQYGVNPMGGCLPMLFQIPVFFGFYNMLQYAVELRNQPFLGWVTDLSQPDTVGHVMGLPINILPILMAVTMFLQMQITPKTGDKMQQRIFMLMPLIFFFFCYNFASALALYWTVQNIFSIGQTYLMQKMPEPELKTAKNAGKKSWMQKMADRAEEAQKQRKGQQKAGGRPGQKQAKIKKPRGPKTGG